MLIIIRTEYDNRIIVTKMVSMFFLIKLRKPTRVPIKNLPNMKNMV